MVASSRSGLGLFYFTRSQVINKEQRLIQACNDPSFLIIAGSRLYGTDREGSDYDYRGFTIPPLEYLIGVNKFECFDMPNQQDSKIYSLWRFLQLTMSGDPQTTEMLFANDFIRCNYIGQTILALTSKIVSNRIYNRIMGYSNSEWRKVLGQKIVIESRVKSEDDVIMDIRNVFKPNKADMDDLIAVLLKNKKHKIVQSVTNLGAKRKKDIEKYGFCVSSASHAIRLLQELEELLLTGRITFPRHNASFLKQIRRGEASLERVNYKYQEAIRAVKIARCKSILPDQPDYEYVMKKYIEIIKGVLCKI